MKSLIYLTFLFSSFQLFSQNTFVDIRDQQVYSYHQANGLNWMTENLRYLSPNSYCKAIKPKDEICQQYNFYPKQDLSEVCPEGWNIPSESQWDEFFAWYYKQRIKLKGEIKLDTMDKEDNVDSQAWYQDETKKLDLFDPENKLNFSSSNWVQGKKLGDRENMTMWLSNGDSNFHVHFGHVGVVKHNHKHHIEDKKRKIRQFVVRCVQPAKI